MAYAYSNFNDSSTTLSKNGAEQDADILREFKRKLAEDESYITYFNERIRIEQTYIDALNRLHSKTSGQDSAHDDPGPRGTVSSTRLAWKEVRDYTLREVVSREAFINAVREDVINKLSEVRDTQARIRTRIRDDLKVATEDYEDYAFSKLPKLKRTYHNRTQALVDFKRQEHAIEMQAKLLSESNQLTPSDGRHLRSASISTPSSTTPPNQSEERSPITETSQANRPPSPVPGVNFQATSPTDRRGISGRNRSGSGSLTALRDVADQKSKEVFQDIAAQGKKGFSAIMQRFQQGAPDGPMAAEVAMPVDSQRLAPRASVSRSTGALKVVKIKRDADEADKAYRTGVFECESRRLRREKLHQSATASLCQFNDELNATLKVSLRAFTDATQATAASLAQSTDVLAASISSINLPADTMLFRSRAPNPVQNTPILYDNFYVGPCRSLIFGVSLTDYDYARGEGGDHGRPPLIVEKCLAALDARGLRSAGIYRMSGRQATVKQMVQDIERNEEVFQFAQEEDVYSIAVVLKQYLRELPEPLFPLPLAERVKYTENREQHISNSFATLRGRLRRLPPIHQTTFQAILEHLTRVASHLADNKMDPKNLAVVFNSVLFGPEQVTASANPLTMHLEKDSVLEDLITYSDILFRAPSPASMEASRGEIQRPGSGHAKLTIAPVTATPPELSHEAYSKLEALQFEDHIFIDTNFTPDEMLTLLFDPIYIPESMRAAVGEEFHVRPLASNDLLRSHFGLLSNLSVSPPLAPSVYTSLFNALKSCQDTYYICVVVDRASDQVVASGTLIREKKFTHGAGLAGHIEDIVTSEDVRGRGIGKALVEGLRELAVELGCYKVILDCQEAKVPFYEKCGFKLRGRQMAYYVPETEPPKPNSKSPASTKMDDAKTDLESVAETMDTTDTTDSGVTYHFPTTNGSSGTVTPRRRPADLDDHQL